MLKYRILIICTFFLAIHSCYGQSKSKKIEVDKSIEIGTDILTFFKEGTYLDQKIFYPSLYVRPKFSLDWTTNNHSITFEGFARYDPNGNSRTHWDIREFYYQTYNNNWEFNFGIKRYFWGKLETVHLVDVINQVDFLEGLDGDEKLGQPILEAIYSSSIGDFSLIAMPYFRTIDFGNQAGRPRTPEVITDEQISYGSELEKWHPSFALRWSHFIGDLDVGLHYFYGNAREPLILFNANGFGLQYPVVNQAGIDAQLIVNNMLLKLESMYRAGDFENLDNIFTLGAGVEYTFGNVNRKGLDIGILAEYLYDNRRELSFSSLDNDLFIGSRIALNNEASTELIFGVFKDLSKSSFIGRAEASQRLPKDFKLSLNIQFFAKVDPSEFVYLFRNDSNVEVEVIKFF